MAYFNEDNVTEQMCLEIATLELNFREVPVERDQGDRSLICSPKIRIRKRKSSRGFRFLFVYVLRLRYACGATHSCEPRMFLCINNF